jgi:hypothetical protein
MGIEPTSEAWEASILPLYDARSLFPIVLRNRFHVQMFALCVLAGFEVSSILRVLSLCQNTRICGLGCTKKSF